MKILTLSDTHIGRYKYGKITNTGNDSRTEDILNNIDQAIDYADKNKINIIVFDGDLYHEKKPSEIYKRLLAQRISRILSLKIEVFILTGNHDQGKTSAHNMSEMFEMSSHIELLNIIENPEIRTYDDFELYFFPHINRIDSNIAKEKFAEHQLENIRKLCSKAKKSKIKHKIFFGHFGTNVSKSGNSFDLGSMTDLDDVVSISEFDKDVWNKVYLGHIHKQQEINEVVRHVGSTARIDFGEENEQKGFYVWENGKDNFIKLKDRQFKTLEIDLNCDDARKKMNEVCSEIQDLDLSKAITRLKVTIKTNDKKIISFKGIEDYLKDVSWTYIGKSITEIREEHNIVFSETSEELNHQQIFVNYVGAMKEKIKPELFENIIETGKRILSEVSNGA
jgi:exonuclease SbcD